LNRNYLKRFYRGQEALKWHGYLVMAADGSRAEIPNSKENRRVYGESINKYGKQVARTNLSALYDVFNRFLLDIGIPEAVGTRAKISYAEKQTEV
jgi:hypothetical protein